MLTDARVDEGSSDVIVCRRPQIAIIPSACDTPSPARRLSAACMAHPWVDDERLAAYPGTVKEGYLVKSPPLDGKGVKLKVYIMLH